MNEFDTRNYINYRIAETVQEMEWRPDSSQAMRAWQSELRAKLRKLVGGLDSEPIPLSPRIVETKEFASYRRETILLASRPGLELFGYFLTPKSVTSPTAAVLCLPGHGRGVDSIVGIAEDGSQREIGKPEEYQYDMAPQCVEKGFPAFAIEQMSFGHRRDAKARDSGAAVSSCSRDSMAALMLGETMTGWRVWDAMRGLDYMLTRPEVDPEKLITMGISGGGLTSLFTTALDTRVAACVVSGYFNTFRDSILAIDHCVDNYVPGLLQLVEMPDLAGLIAPRLLFTEGGDRDPIFPVEALEQANDRARKIYAAFGVPAHFDSQLFEGEHWFHGKGAFAFLHNRLS